MNNPTRRPAALDGLLAHIARRIDQIEADTLTPHGPRQQIRPGNRTERHGDAMKPPTPTHTTPEPISAVPRTRQNAERPPLPDCSPKHGDCALPPPAAEEASDE